MTTDAQAVIAGDMSERQLQNNVVAALKAHGWLVYHTFDSRRSAAGFPDIVALRFSSEQHHTEMIVVELKAEKGKPTWEQVEWLMRFETVPGCVYAGVLRPSGWLAGELDEVMR